ncbi:alpha/beta hydrolase [Rugamonas aquatica]|uniref:Alpha/beta hydrolase fold domain-containing protein n=1 Tax=Rugamonas aquatica TaxID=2743357 RepID=A0A6A7N651_9BURK|nr:alpha/beta hydrolase fold domain-containing protein [Rugamonas aquatica]MQA40378.1 alpha/beta hydrolase fold domain-containing protein [Rugamonas aquatica]
MIWICLHGWGSSAQLFQAEWEAAGSGALGDDAPTRLFLDGLEAEPVSGNRRWFPFTGRHDRLAAALRDCGPRLEALVAHRLEQAGIAPQTPLGILGHSQGGMLALALAARQRLNIVRAAAFAAFLPAPYMERAEPGRRGGVRVALYSSTLDPYVTRAPVHATAEWLRSLDIGSVDHHIVAGLPHAFSPAWIQAATGEPTPCPL